jgi:hypothetical protein
MADTSILQQAATTAYNTYTYDKAHVGATNPVTGVVITADTVSDDYANWQNLLSAIAAANAPAGVDPGTTNGSGEGTDLPTLGSITGGSNSGATQAPDSSAPVSLDDYSPDPVYAGVTVFLSGYNIGICSGAQVSFSGTDPSGNTSLESYDLPLTKVNQNQASFVFPDTALTRAKPDGTLYQVYARYSINGVPGTTNVLAMYVGQPPAVQQATASGEKQYGYHIPDGEPVRGYQVLRWVFYDPYDGNPDTQTATVEINPNAMDTPFPTRNYTYKATTAINGQVLAWEGQQQPAQWTFSGLVLTARQYDLLRSWVYDRDNRIQITDHFGRVITCSLSKFDAKPQRAYNRYWKHGFTISALVYSITKPTVVPV